ncbi:hypothetical protein ACQ4PT_025740 [Festuca glaucescens]
MGAGRQAVSGGIGCHTDAEMLLLLNPDLNYSYADVDMADGGPLILVHRCILVVPALALERKPRASSCLGAGARRGKWRPARAEARGSR